MADPYYAVVFATVGGALWLRLGRHERQHLAILGRLGPVLILGALGELALGAVL